MPPALNKLNTSFSSSVSTIEPILFLSNLEYLDISVTEDADADFEQQQECSISLDEQIQQDQDDGLDCQLGNDTGNSSDTGDTGLSYFFD